MNNVTILVGTCDRYGATWPAFCHGLNKHWADRPWPVKATTNYLDFPCGDGLKVGTDKDWATTVKLSLQKLDTTVVFWMLDDTWLTGSPDTTVLKQFVQCVLDGKLDYIRLIKTATAKSAGQTPFDKRLFFLKKTAQYRTSVAPSIWRRQTFINTLKEGESAWDFETIGSKRSTGHICCCPYFTDWDHLPHVAKPKWGWGPVKRGLWTGDAKRYALQEGLLIDFQKQPKHGI